MGLRSNILTNLLIGHGGDVFSEDVLKIEVRGPREDYLTIIDVPGIFRATTNGTTKDDMAMVKDLVTRYIKDDRTIILAVLPSNVDIATQEILELAEEYDKNGERTLGVLTKPDLVLETSAQNAVCDLILGKKRPLTLGYFLVRNRGADGGVTLQSDLDQALRKQPWNDLPRERIGIAALKEQLGPLLVDMTRREFPKLLRDVGDQIKACKKELNSLGPPRQDEREQRSFLSQIAATFQDRARAALAGDYNADSSFDQEELRLITRVVNITELFSADFQQGAHSRRFEEVKLPKRPLESDVFNGYASDSEEAPIKRMIDTLRTLVLDAKVDNVTPEEYVELGDIIVLPQALPKPRDDVTAWIKDIYMGSRGLDLGTFNANLVSIAFAEQSRKWGEGTKRYMSRVIIVLHRFIAAALRSVLPEEHAREELWSAVLDSLLERYRNALDQASLLIEVERRKQPYTLNRQFTEALSKSRAFRITELMRPRARKDNRQFGELQYTVNLDDIVKAAEDKSNVEQLQEEIHDILRAYYSLALDRFIDNVFQLAVDYPLLHGPSSPLKVFTQDWVINLEAEQLERIVGETKSAKKQRSRIVKKIDDLSNALTILKN